MTTFLLTSDKIKSTRINNKEGLMIDLKTLKELEIYNNSPFKIMSVYLGADNLQSPSKKLLLTQFHSLLHQNLSSEQRETYEFDIKRIEEYINNYTPSDRSLIFFSAGECLWKVIGLKYSIPDEITIDFSPNITPLVISKSDYPKYLVLLVDREKALMFTAEQNEIVDKFEFHNEGFVPQNKKKTGHDNNTDSAIMNRRTEMYLDKHIERVSQEVAKFAKNKDIKYLIIGGHKQLFNRIEAVLPTDLYAKLAGNFVTELNIPLNDILLEVKEIIKAIS